MSTLKTNNVQVGQSVTATNNFTLYQPSTPDGTVRIGVGNSGATTSDAVVIGSSGITKGVISSGTAVTASGTSVDFTGIPSTAKRITVMFNGVSLSGTSHILVQIGSGAVTTSGYTAASYATNNSGVSSTAGFIMVLGTAALATVGSMSVHLLTGTTWVSSHAYAVSGATASAVGGGVVSLSGTLDRIRITTVNGTDTFDAGTINILYEG